jgi:hypothetical protein
LLGAAAVAAVFAVNASAQQVVDHPGLCGVFQREWGALAQGRDIEAMRRALSRTPQQCPGLRRRIAARIAEIEARVRPVRAPGAAPARPAPRAAEPLRPVNIPREVRAAMTPDAYSNFERQTRRALAYFRPSTIRQTIYSESSIQYVESRARNRGCQLRHFPRDARDVSIEESTIVRIRRTPFVVESTIETRRTACDRPGASTPGVASAPFVAIAIPGLDLRAASAGQDDVQFEADLGAAANSQARTIRFQTQDRNGTCRDMRRYEPGEWQAGFPFRVYEMGCRFRWRAVPGGPELETNGTYFFAPDLSAQLSCGGEETTLRTDNSGEGLTDTPVSVTTADIRALREGNVVRLKCNFEAQAYTPERPYVHVHVRTKGEREDIITLQ